MSTKINIEYQKKNYTLEYSRQSARQMEDNGFILEQLTEKPVTMIPMLVHGAFMKHHKGIKRALVDEIFEHLTGKEGTDGENGFLAALVEMYAETVNTLTDSKADDEGNAATWKVVKG